VAEIQPITHPAKSKRKTCNFAVVAPAATAAKSTAQTTAQPMLYAV
jgi:hypothetical protein